MTQAQHQLEHDINLGELEWAANYLSLGYATEGKNGFEVWPHIDEVMRSNIINDPRTTKRRKMERLRNLDLFKSYWMRAFKASGYSKLRPDLNDKMVKLVEKRLKRNGLLSPNAILRPNGKHGIK